MGSSCSFTHPGHVRRNNEDAYYTDDLKGLWIVCDGMGGHQEGNFASHLVTDMFERMKMVGGFDAKIEAITTQLSNIHILLRKKVHEMGEGTVIGTTVALLFVEEGKGVSIHSGDSRCYILRNGRLSKVTEDHAEVLQTNGRSRKYLTKALSAPGEFFLEIKKFRVLPNDVFLLCTDGLYDNVTISMLKRAMQASDAQKGLELLGNAVLSKQADDNLTAVMVRI